MNRRAFLKFLGTAAATTTVMSAMPSELLTWKSLIISDKIITIKNLGVQVARDNDGNIFNCLIFTLLDKTNMNTAYCQIDMALLNICGNKVEFIEEELYPSVKSLLWARDK